MSRGVVLLADDDASQRLVLSRALRGHGLEVDAVADGHAAWRRLQHGGVDAAVLDVRMPGPTGLELLARCRDLPRPPAVLIVTAQDTMANAIEAMKGGAYDYLTKPLDLDRFEAIVLRAVEDHRLAEPDAQRADGEGRILYGRGPAMQEVFKAIGRAAGSPHAVLITGESGTGKELVARILHQEGPRAERPFVAVNAAAIPAELLEADLFGHARGAFTGAHVTRAGKFEAADGGTLFLDEIGELPLGLQAKLLRVLEEKAFYPLGAARQVRVDVRIVTATHRDLATEAAAGRFRGDLYYRLNVLGIHLPPLRERPEDIPRLADWLLRKHAREHGLPPRTLTADALAWLSDQPWPGNVRELENALVRAATFAQGPAIRAVDLAARGARGAPPLDERFEDAVRHRLRPLVRDWPAPTTGRSDLHAHVVGAVEAAVIELALERCGGNQLHAAALLGINRNTLRRKLDELGLEPRRQR